MKTVTILKRGDNKLNSVINYIMNSNVSDITPKKLQHLLYYSYIWNLTLNNKILFNNCFKAGIHGPVIQEVDNKFNRYRGINIPTKLFNSDYILSDDEIDIINQVLNIYGKFNGNELESISTKELPWVDARQHISPIQMSNNQISNESIYDFYSKNIKE